MYRLFSWRLIVVGFCLLLQCSLMIYAVPDSERKALLDIYDNCLPANWNPYTTGFEDPCDPVWDGLSCIADENIENIQLQGALGKECSIPRTIGVFSKMKLLDFSKNSLVGIIPEQLYSARELRYINFGEAKGLVGSISPYIGRLTLLNHLDLSNNKLNGTIPDSLYALKNLTYLSLSQNADLGGTLSPDGFGNFTQIKNLFISSTNLGGSIPDSIGNFSSILQLQLYENKFSGPIPPIICKLNTLTGLWLNGNELSGTIPACVNQLTNLKYLYFSDNKLEGGIPESVFELKNLLNLFLGGNNLGGNISSSVGNLGEDILELHVGEAKISGSIPPEIGKLTGLTYLNVGVNYLTGQVPEGIGNMQNLSIFIATSIPQRGERLSGSFPESIFSLQKLTVLMLATNQFNNTLPTVIGGPDLQQLDLSDNQFTGWIPNSLYNSTKLQNFKLYKNKIYGTISEMISNLKDLQQLDLNSNQLTGVIPSFFNNNATKWGSPPGTVLSGNPFFCPVPQWAKDNAGAGCSLWQYKSVTPDHAKPGTTITFIGSQFSIWEDIRCEFGEFGSTAVVSANQTTIVCPLPSNEDVGANKTIVSISYNNVTINSAGDLTVYLFGTPYVNFTIPESGRQQGRTNVTVFGRNFAATDKWNELYCKFNDKIVPGTFINGSSIMCSSPEMDPGDVIVQVSNAGNDSFAASSVVYTYFEFCDGFPYCSGHGECNTSVSPPLCVCAYNFLGSLCESCQPLYFGSNCDACPNCGDHGVCNDGIQNNGKCTCQAGYYGKLCYECPACDHGSCDDGEPGSGNCECDIGYGGELCDSLWKVWVGLGAVGLAIICGIIFLIYFCIMRKRRERKEAMELQKVAKSGASRDFKLPDDAEDGAKAAAAVSGEKLDIKASQGLDGDTNNEVKITIVDEGGDKENKTKDGQSSSSSKKSRGSSSHSSNYSSSSDSNSDTENAATSESSNARPEADTPATIVVSDAAAAPVSTGDDSTNATTEAATPVNNSDNNSTKEDTEAATPVIDNNNDSPAAASKASSPVNTSNNDSPKEVAAVSIPVNNNNNDSPKLVKEASTPVNNNNNDSPKLVKEASTPVNNSNNDSPKLVKEGSTPVNNNNNNEQQSPAVAAAAEVEGEGSTPSSPANKRNFRKSVHPFANKNNKNNFKGSNSNSDSNDDSDDDDASSANSNDDSSEGSYDSNEGSESSGSGGSSNV